MQRQQIKPMESFLENNHYFQLKEVGQSIGNKWEEEDKVLFDIETYVFRTSKVQHKMVQHEVEGMILDSEENKFAQLIDSSLIGVCQR